MSLDHDIILDEDKFSNASDELNQLKTDTEELKKDLSSLYDALENALQTPAGEQMKLTAKDVLIKPIDDLLLVIDHTSKTLTKIIGPSYYQDVFVKYRELNQSIK